MTVVNPVVATAVGLTLFGEGFRHGTAGGVVALAFGVVSAGGLVLLSRAQPSDGDAGGTPGGGAPAGTVPVAGRSDVHAVRPQVGERVDVAPVRGPRAHLEVKMRSRYVAGGS